MMSQAKAALSGRANRINNMENIATPENGESEKRTRSSGAARPTAKVRVAKPPKKNPGDGRVAFAGVSVAIVSVGVWGADKFGVDIPAAMVASITVIVEAIGAGVAILWGLIAA